MTVTFCGHGDIKYDDKTKQILYNEVENLIKTGENEFLFGGYGSFDITAAHTVKSLKVKYPHIKSTLVIPYLGRKYNMDLYDDTVYPPLENVPKKFAIVKRNEWAVNKSDVIISYVEHGWGGAAKTLNYAVKKKKDIINIAKKNSI